MRGASLIATEHLCQVHGGGAHLLERVGTTDHASGSRRDDAEVGVARRGLARLEQRGVRLALREPRERDERVTPLGELQLAHHLHHDAGARERAIGMKFLGAALRAPPRCSPDDHDLTPAASRMGQSFDKEDIEVEASVEISPADANVPVAGVAKVEAIQAVYGKYGKYCLWAGLAMMMIVL